MKTIPVGRESDGKTRGTLLADVTPLGVSRKTSHESVFENLTIRDAQTIYAESGRYRPFRDLLQKTASGSSLAEFDNNSYLDALFFTELMFERAEHEIRILSGPAGDGFISTLATSFDIALQRVRQTKGFIRVILLSCEVPEYLVEKRKQFSDVLDVALAQANQPVKHFMVCDSRSARLEEEHEELKPETLAGAVKAKIYLNQPEKAVWLEQFFDSVWSNLHGSEGSK